MRLLHDVISIDADKHTILVQDLKTKKLIHDDYDKLIMATGSITAIPAISGIENPKVMLCKTCDQAHELYAAAQTHHKIAIVGGGYAGVELAEGYIKSGHEVTLIERGPHILNQYMDPIMAKRVQTLLVEHGVKILTNTTVTQFDDLKNEQINVKTTKSECAVDMVAIAPGVIPQSDLLAGQVKLSKNGAIVTDPYMCTTNPDIFAAGDATEVRYNPTLSQAYMPLASHAVRQGTLAGINVLDKRLRSIGTQATTGMLLFGKTIACTGLTFEKAQKLDSILVLPFTMAITVLTSCQQPLKSRLN